MTIEGNADNDVVDDVADEPRSAPSIAQIRGDCGRTGFILGSQVRPAHKTSRIIETQEPQCPNILRLYSGKSNMPWNGSGASFNPRVLGSIPRRPTRAVQQLSPTCG